MATTPADQGGETGPDTTVAASGHSRSTVLAVFGLVVAVLVGFGLGWLAFRDTGTDIPDEVQQVVEAYQSAVSDHDGDAAVALMHGNAKTYVENSSGLGGEDLARAIDNFPQAQLDHEIVTVFGDEPYVLVSETSRGGGDMLQVLHVAEIDGVYKIITEYLFSTSIPVLPG